MVLSLCKDKSKCTVVSRVTDSSPLAGLVSRTAVSLAWSQEELREARRLCLLCAATGAKAVPM